MAKIKKMNLKGTMRAFSIVWMIVLIIVMTITNIGIDKSFNWMTWVSNSMILFGVAVFGLLIGESSGIDIQKERENGLFQRTLRNYDDYRNSIDNLIIYFPLFYDWYVPQRIEKKYIQFLVEGGMHPKKAENIVKYCSMDDFLDLKSHAIEKTVNGKVIHIKKLLEKEVEPVKMVFNGDVAFKQSGAAYYLQAFAESNQADLMEVGEVIRETRAKNRRMNRAVRLVSGLIVSLALGILTVNDFMKGNDTQAWLNLVARITNLFTALLSGYLSGVSDVTKQANAIENKTDVLKMFKNAYEKKLFTMYSEEEGAKREFEQYQKEEQEAKDNVIDPEVVTEEQPKDEAAPSANPEPEINPSINLLENKSNQLK